MSSHVYEVGAPPADVLLFDMLLVLATSSLVGFVAGRKPVPFVELALRHGRVWVRSVRRSLTAFKAARRYTLAGAAFGLCFPVAGTLMACYIDTGSLGWAQLVATQRQSPLLWIIDTAPFWLGLFAGFAGRRQDRLRTLNGRLRDELQRRREYEVRLEHAREHAEAAQTRAEVARRKALDAKERALEAARVKSAILDTVSHELRTPLSSIIGFAEVLAEEAPPEQQEFAGYILQSGQRLKQTVHSVLEIAQQQKSGPVLQHEEVDLRGEAEAVAALLRPIAQERGLYLRIEGASAAAVHTDRACVNRILRHLLENALNFTDCGGVALRIEEENGAARIAVSDTGIGIGSDFLPHLFESFRRESEGLQRRGQGSGLGLAVSKHLAARVGGSIEVASEKGEGSTFTLRLPRQAPCPT